MPQKTDPVYGYKMIESCQEGKPHRVVRLRDGKRLYRFANADEAEAKVKDLNKDPRPEDV